MTSAISSTPTDLSQLGATATAKKDEAGSADRFLKLLVAQMQNQDPLNPMDNAQVTSQMAQINTVNGIEKLNQTVNKLMSRPAVSVTPNPFSWSLPTMYSTIAVVILVRWVSMMVGKARS